jgi:DNA-directed RNA polymerase specialized sigma24 family protein
MKPQFESTPELATDLEWHLQNGKASQAALAGLLVSEFYSDAFRLSWAVLGDLDRARQTVERAFISALVNQYRYRLGQDARTWLFRFVIQEVEKSAGDQNGPGNYWIERPAASLDRLDGFLRSLEVGERQALFASILLGWQPLEVSELTGVEVARIERIIDDFRQTSRQYFSQTQSFPSKLSLEQALLDRFPKSSLTDDEQAAIAARLVRAAERIIARKMGFMRLWETCLTAAGVVLVAGLILWLNQMLPELPPKGVTSTPTARVVRVTRVVLVPVTRTVLNSSGSTSSRQFRQRGAQAPVLLPPLPPPLNPASTPQDVIRRLTSSQSLWSTIWVDAQLTRNGPTGYIGPPDVTYEQAWIDNPSKRSIELSGKSSDRPDWVYMLDGTAGTQISRKFPQPQNFPGDQPLKSEQLRAMIFPLNSDWLSSGNDLVIGKLVSVIGRKALRVSVVNPAGFLQAQLWVDVETGVILRELRFTGDRSQIQIADFSLTKITYNEQFSESLFDPQARLAFGFSTDASGLVGKLQDDQAPMENTLAHQPFAAGLAPNGFNPAQAQLFFRFPDTFYTNATSTVVDILAGGYTLGKAQFGNPWTMICARSPDGGVIAFVSQPSEMQSGDASLYWFGLENVNQVHQVSKDLVVDDFTFSPDGQKLSFFGRLAGQERGAIYIYDLQNGVLQPLLDRNSADSLVWSPDGQYLAMTSAPSMYGTRDALVVDVHNGTIVAHDRYNWQGDFTLDPLSPDWPTLTWRTPKGSPVAFPVSMGGMEACVQPPD